MIAYASRTGTKRNLAALRDNGWRVLVSARGCHRNEGFRYSIDNGAWTSFQKNEPFDDGSFLKVLEKLGEGADWITVPDVVGVASASLEMTERWLPRLEQYERLLVCVQDGMTEQDVAPWLGRSCGVFLGGSTEWKLKTMRAWGDVAARRGCHYHVARVNSARRIFMARESGAHSIDGSSASRFSNSLPPLQRALKEPLLWKEREPVFGS